MKRNVHDIERGVRVILGLTLIGLAAAGTIGMWGWIGLVPLATGAIGNCPLYSIFGFSTCKTR